MCLWYTNLEVYTVLVITSFLVGKLNFEENNLIFCISCALDYQYQMEKLKLQHCLVTFMCSPTLSVHDFNVWFADCLPWDLELNSFVCIMFDNCNPGLKCWKPFNASLQFSLQIVLKSLFGFYIFTSSGKLWDVHPWLPWEAIDYYKFMI